ncbi:U32 family peptidase [bacterium]|nr:U32 family peptidase [bacterium]
MKKPELVAPAGNLEKLKVAIDYGADAVYIGGKRWSLRARTDNFTLSEIKKAVDYAHKRKKKVYVALNIFAHNKDFVGLENYIKKLSSIGIDAYIVSDPGIISVIQEVSPEANIHLSTQVSTSNQLSAEFWEREGIKRIVLSRELSKTEIKNITKKTKCGIEIFIHGAMCMAHSGRCLLSSFMTGRSANLGDCAQPCRWKYFLNEEVRHGEYFPVFEGDRGSFIFNSKDLCLIEHIPEIFKTGVNAVKIEGRMKSLYYIACVTRVYRQAIDEYASNPSKYRFRKTWLDELKKISHRGYTTGFFLNKPNDEAQVYKSSSYIKNYEFVGVVTKTAKSNISRIEVRNKICVGDKLEVIGPSLEDDCKEAITNMTDKNGNEFEVANHGQIVFIKAKNKLEKGSLLRRQID